MRRSIVNVNKQIGLPTATKQSNGKHFTQCDWNLPHWQIENLKFQKTNPTIRQEKSTMLLRNSPKPAHLCSKMWQDDMHSHEKQKRLHKRSLSDTRTYMKLDRDYTPDVVEHVKYTLEQYKRGGLLSDYMVRRCMPKPECRTALLHFLTKTHKSPMMFKPIVSQVGSARSNMAGLLLVQSLPAYL